MPVKKKTNKKPQSTRQWYRSLSKGYKTLLFILVFAVLGGGFAVYKSFAYSWFKAITTTTADASVCEYTVTKSGYKYRWAVYNKTKADHTFAIFGPFKKDSLETLDGTLREFPLSIKASSIGIISPDYAVPSGTYNWELGVKASNGSFTFIGNANLNRDFIQDCGSSSSK